LIVNCVEDLRALARRRVPRAFFDYADRGSYDEITLERNRADLDAIALRQRVLVDLAQLSLATTVLGQAVAMPLAIAPTGLAGMFHGDGEIHAARAAQAFGIPFTLSTMSICSLEQVRAAVQQPFWFQVYLMRDRGFNAALIERARAAECSALMLTVDLPILAVRRRDLHNGLSVPPRLQLKNLLDLASKPRWIAGLLRARSRTFGNLAGHIPGTPDMATLAEWTARQFDPSVTWRDVDWVRSRWSGKLILKGILDRADAERACASGADAIVVSNHGGRQLDGAPSSISVLPEVVEAVAGRAEVWFDGGIRSGSDILKAVALGARIGLTGKSFLYALAAGGEAGVRRLLEILRDELAVSMALVGQVDVRRVSQDILRPASRYPAARSAQ
jgi:L-lactate dehydrogenase (cytochrome)